MGQDVYFRINHLWVCAGWVSVCMPSIVPGPIAWGESVFGRCSFKPHLHNLLPLDSQIIHTVTILAGGGEWTLPGEQLCHSSAVCTSLWSATKPLWQMHDKSWIVYCPCGEHISQWVTFGMTLHKDRITSHMTSQHRSRSKEFCILTTIHDKNERGK